MNFFLAVKISVYLMTEEITKLLGGFMDFALQAIDLARQLGAEYADIRIQYSRSERIYLQNTSIKGVNNSELNGYGIRFFKEGAWGFASNYKFTADEVARTVHRAKEIALNSARINRDRKLTLASERGYIDEFRTLIVKDPFEIPLNEKVDLMLEVNKKMMSYDKVKRATFWLQSEYNDKVFASTLGSYIKSKTWLIEPTFTATVVGANDSQTRSLRPGASSSGWEFIESLNVTAEADRVAREAIMKLEADSLDGEARRDLVLDPAHLALTMHESVGHPTELDRVLGWEADFAGISFATPEKLKNYQYGTKDVNFCADNLLPNGLATAGYDDDGVPNQKWYIVKDGILNEYGTTRDTAPIIGESMSRGCSRATYYYDFPINRIPNLYLEPGKEKLSPSDLIADVEDGVFIEGQGSFSIDQHRVNFQFGGDMFWRIEKGKITKPLKKILYRSNNPEFWNNVDGIADARFWKPWGVSNCGKGQPGQTGRMTHGASPTRFRNIRVGGSK
jgi:TldD protein